MKGLCFLQKRPYISHLQLIKRESAASQPEHANFNKSKAQRYKKNNTFGGQIQLWHF